MFSGYSVAVLFLFFSGVAQAENRVGAIPDDSWPASWFRPPPTASQAGIAAFRESPLLAGRVAQGKLPPLRERLPEDPYIIEPTERIGRHGGSMRIFNWVGWLDIGLENPLTIDPSVRDALPNLASAWAFSDDGRTFTLSLRPGLKWSDGHPFTSDDFVFWHRHILLNEQLTPAIPPRWQGSKMEAAAPHTVRFTFIEPFPAFIQELAHHGGGYAAPAHFLKKYHPDFTDRKTIENHARREGFISWMAYFGAVRGEALTDPVGTPSMNAFVLKRKSPTLLGFERNPFYPKIDPDGNQLPYLDETVVMLVRNPEVAAARISTGQAHFAAGLARDIPLFKLGEKTHRFTTFIWRSLNGSEVTIQPNLTSEDPELRTIFQDARFRKALSLAINRDEINTVVYFNRAVPRQTTVNPNSRYYEPEFASAFSACDPDAARRLLDEMGVIDQDGDGRRERPGGAALSLTLEFLELETPKAATMELVIEYWREVGLNVHLKQVDSGLQASRARGNLMQMTLWHAALTSDILFPSQPWWFVPMHVGWEECHWTPWSTWYLSRGQRGEVPPPDIRQLIDWWKEMDTTMDEVRRIELGKNILRSQAENVWTIGTLGLAPQPVVVSDALLNVPRQGYWGWDNRWTLPYHPETWFLEEKTGR